MSRFLFVSLPLTGHVNPMAAVAKALFARGHEVAWAGSESFLRPAAGEDAVIYGIPLRAHRGQRERGLAATKSRWEGYIVPHARVTRKGIEAAVADFQPDVIAVDQHAIGAAIIAHQRNIPWATIAPTTMELTRPLRTMPKVEAWIQSQMDDIWAAAGCDGKPPFDLRFSPYLLVAFTGTALTGEENLPDNAQLVGPALAKRPPDDMFPWEWLDSERAKILVTMGTISMDHASESFYRRALEALAPLGDRLQAIVLAPEGGITSAPEHVLVRQRVPVLELMPRLQAVVSHGGLNTVCEALFHGVPLVIAPVKGDQAINASHVAAAGAGLRISFDRSTSSDMYHALRRVLAEPSFPSNAARIGKSFATAGGATAAAAHLEQLASQQSQNEKGANSEVLP